MSEIGLDFLLLASGDLSSGTGNLTIPGQASVRLVGQALRRSHEPDSIAVARFPHLGRNLGQVSMIMRHALSCAILTEGQRGPLDYRGQLAEYAQNGRPTIVIPMPASDLQEHLLSLDPGFSLSSAALTATIWLLSAKFPAGHPDQAVWAAPQQLLVPVH